MKQVIFVLVGILTLINSSGQTEERESEDCIDCSPTLTIREGQGFNTTMKLKDLSISELENMVETDQFESPEVRLESITNIFNYYFIRNLGNNVYLKIIPLFPDDFSFDYLTTTNEELIRQTRKMQVNCAFIYLHRDCVSKKLNFDRTEEGNTKLSTTY